MSQEAENPVDPGKNESQINSSNNPNRDTNANNAELLANNKTITSENPNAADKPEEVIKDSEKITTENPISENNNENDFDKKSLNSLKNKSSEQEKQLNISKTIKDYQENASKNHENKITDKDLETSVAKEKQNPEAEKTENSGLIDKQNKNNDNNLNKSKLSESKINKNNNSNNISVNNNTNSDAQRESKKSEKDLKLLYSENNPFIDKQEKMLLEITKNEIIQKEKFDKLEKNEKNENESNSNKNNNININNKNQRNAKAINTSKNASIILNTYNYPENNNIENENEEAEIQININDNDISNINKEKMMERHEISESSGAVVKLFTGEKNEIIEILNERLTEKEKQNKVLIQEIERLKKKPSNNNYNNNNKHSNEEVHENCVYQKQCEEYSKSVKELTRLYEDLRKRYEILTMKSNQEKEDFKSNLVSLNQEKTKLEETLFALKKKYQQEMQTNKIDIDTFKQVEKKDKAIIELKAKLNLKEQTNDGLVKEIHKLKRYEELSRHLRNKYNIVIQEKMDIDEILMRQEEKIKELNTQNEILRQETSNKNQKIEESDKNILNIVKTMDKQKNLVNKLKTNLASKEKELEETKFTLLERDQEILYLRNYLNALKLDPKTYESKYKYYKNNTGNSKSVDKKNLIKSNDLRKSNEANKLKFSMISEIGNINTEDSPIKRNNNKSYLNDQYYGNNEKSRLIMHPIDENDNENLKEITMLMRKILEE